MTENIMGAIRESGLVTATLDDLGLAKFSNVRVVLTKTSRTERNPLKFPDVEDGPMGSVRERIEREQDHAAQAHTVLALQAALEQSRRQLDAVVSAYHRTSTAERLEALAQLA